MTKSPLVLTKWALKTSGALATSLDGSSSSGWTVEARGPEGGGGVAAAAVVAAAVGAAGVVEEAGVAALLEALAIDVGSSVFEHPASASSVPASALAKE